MTAVESDGAGLRVTYRLDGVDHRVHLSDFGTHTQGEFDLHARDADTIYGLVDHTGSFVGTPEFDHFNVHDWYAAAITDAGITASTQRGFVVYGASTEAADLPAGTATYEGRAHLRAWLPDNPSFNAKTDASGRLMLNANFDAGTVSGGHRPDRHGGQSVDRGRNRERSDQRRRAVCGSARHSGRRASRRHALRPVLRSPSG